MAIKTPASALPAEYAEAHPDPAGGRLRAFFAPWHRRALVLVAVVAAFCDFYQLQRNGYANLYYAAAIRSMLRSWHNFFFVSFDPGGFVSVDKPPLGFWIQTASAKLFGYSGFSILLPEALAGVASVLVLYVLVRRVFGSAAGLLAALFLAMTPVSAVTNRNNTIDSLLVLTVLLAAYAVMRAIETDRGSLRWLLLCAVFVGLSFNIKMLQAYLVVPALALVYLLGAPLGWWERLWHLVLAGAALVAVSLSWVLAVDLTPASARPYVGSSGSNSELALALGYNGIQRLLGNLFRIPTQVASATTSVATNGPGGASENGAQGVFRLLNTQLGGQASWLLALGIVGILAAGWGFRWDRVAQALPERLPTGRSARYARYLRRVRAWRASSAARAAAHLTDQQSALVLWGMWTLTMAVFFSIAGFFHRYYLSMLAPGVAALAGIGVVLLWRDYRSQYAGRVDWRGWLLPAAFVLTALTQAVILAGYTDWSRWMTPLIVGGSFIVAAILVAYRIRSRLAAPLSSAAAGAYTATFVLPDAARFSWVDGGGERKPTHELADNLDVSALLPSVAVSAAGGPSWLDQAMSRAVARLRRWTYAPLIAVALGVALLLVGPATWVGVSLASGAGGTLPSAGPSPTAGLASSGTFGGPGGGGFRGGFPRRAFGGSGAFAPPSGAFGAPPSGAFTPGGISTSNPGVIDSQQVDSGLITYLEAHDGSATYLFATLSSGTAAPYIIVTGKPVMALGGFSGSDQILTLDQLKALIRTGLVKYFLLSGGGFGGPGGVGGSGNSQLVQWIEANGALISASAYGGSAGGQLYYVSPSAAG